MKTVPVPHRSARLKGLLRAEGGLPRMMPARAHGIAPGAIPAVVRELVARLDAAGHVGLVVGGAVRDLLLGRDPKDFDVVTTARPEQVRALFDNARLIGRRFRLALLRYPGMTVEVSTFRGPPQRTARGPIRRDNVYGTPRDDAFRRDFTVNALALDPLSYVLIDYVGGVTDLEAGIIRTIAPPEVSFREDPVRMLRAVRFQIRLGFALEPALEKALRAMVGHLAGVSRHRLAEETQRFLTGGHAAASFTAFGRLGLLEPLLAVAPHAWFFAPRARTAPLEPLAPYLATLDAWAAAEREPIPPTVALLGLLAVLARPAFRAWLRGREPASPAATAYVRRLKGALAPMLADWGMLNGQVGPALEIVEATRALLARTDRKPAAPAAVRGMREACLLALLLAGPLQVPQALQDAAPGWLPDLPDLPILDHPRPPGARRSRRFPRDDGRRRRRGGRRRPGRGRSGRRHDEHRPRSG